jgi:hypothetical protein
MRVFDTAETPGIAVQETRATTINVTLKLGKASESVEVTARCEVSGGCPFDLNERSWL